MNWQKTKTISKKRITLFIALICGIVIFFCGKNLESVFADEEITVCSLDKMVTVGSLMDQTFISVAGVIAEVDEILSESAQASQTATSLIKSSEEDYKPENCQSSCGLAARPWPPLTDCTAGYTCSNPNILPGSDMFVSHTDCVALPSGPISVDSERFYGVFHWRENDGYQCHPFPCPPQYAWCFNHGGDALTVPYDVFTWGECLDWCNLNMNSSQPLCQKNEGSRNCWVNYPPTNGVSNCNWQYTYPNSPFGALWNQGSSVTCYDTCHNEGDCGVDWTTCQERSCSGEACQPCLIEGFVESITANREAIEGAHQNIKDFFEKNITKFPKPDNYTIFGDFCKHPILSKHCSCAAGIGWCASEFYALTALQSKATDNIQKCDIIKPDDLIQGMQGEILFRCKDVRPSPIKQCWQDDFFCCTAEEPK